MPTAGDGWSDEGLAMTALERRLAAVAVPGDGSLAGSRHSAAVAVVLAPPFAEPVQVRPGKPFAPAPSAMIRTPHVPMPRAVMMTGISQFKVVVCKACVTLEIVITEGCFAVRVVGKVGIAPKAAVASQGSLLSSAVADPPACAGHEAEPIEQNGAEQGRQQQSS
jgi:hypothetical protein